MKRLALLLILLIPALLSSQSCLPEGITFRTQEQIDNFSKNYPGCISIKGDTKINGDDITNLDSLSVLISIQGYLHIVHNPLLKNLDGLDNLASIGEELEIENNDSLNSLAGLDNLETIGADLHIRSNPALIDITSLDKLDANSIQEIYIGGNQSLSNCEVLSLCNYLANPVGSVTILQNAQGCNNPGEIAANCGFDLPCLPMGNYYFASQTEIDNFQQNYPGCDSLNGKINISGENITNLYGLNSLTSIKGNLNISWNDSLTTLTGLGNLTSIDGGLTIGWWYVGNPSLKNLTGLNNLTHIGGDLNIHANPLLTSLNGLESLTTIGGSFALGNCDYKKNISENRMNKNSSFKNLVGLNQLTSVGGIFSVQCNDSLISLEGLEKLDSVGGLSISEEISSLNEIGNLSYIGEGGLSIGGTYMSSFEGLENLTSIGGTIWIVRNPNLTNLNGLDHIDSSSVLDLYIYENNLLSTCAIQLICDLLASSNENVYIEENAPGCNSQQEILDSCDFSTITDYGLREIISVNPNPFSTSTTIAFELTQPGKVVLNIYNQLGELIEVIQTNTQSGKQTVTWNANGLPSGIYFIRLQSREAIITRKIIKL